MRINAKTSLIAPTTMDRQKASTGGSSFEAALAGAATASGSASSASSGYDVANMTPNQMQGVAQELYKSGKIDLTQLFMLQNAGMPIGREGANGEFIPLSVAEKTRFSQTPTNYISIVEGAIRFIEQTGMASDPKSGYAQWKGVLAALEDVPHR
jgi:hypothetical protein